MKLFSVSHYVLLNLKLAFAASFFIGIINAQTTDTYSSPGTVDWVVPACVTSVTVRAWGAGGAGGGARSTDRNGGGGGGGAFCTVTEPVTPGETLRITVGAGGTGVSAGTGNAGGFSQVQHLTGSVVFCRAAGGNGGQMGSSSSSAGAGGAGGAIANNIPAGTGFRGGNGGSSDSNTSSTDRSGGGGGGAGTSANGGNGGIVTAGTGGAAGGGNGGAGVSTTSNGGSNGSAGNALGGGGGGSTVFSSGTRAGAAGARGEITITYTVDCGSPGPITVSAFSTPGTYNWVVPACVTSVFVEAWGGGGGGGGNIAVISGGDETCTGAGGGAGGGYAARTYAVTTGESYTIVVGAGGTAGTAGANGGGGSAISTPAGNGGTGGNSTFSGPATVGPGTLTGTGGTGGFAAQGRNTSGGTCLAVNGAGGTGNLGLNGTINFRGGNGAAGVILNFSTDRSAGGGGAAGPSGNGGDAPAANSVGVGVNPPGGTGILPGGNGGNGRTWNLPSLFTGNGGNGADFGGGGGGSLVHIGTFGNATAIGGTGGRGEVRLTYNGCPLPIELMHFGGKNNGEINQLSWITSTERVNDYFTLERSLNGSDWEKVTIVKGAGSTQEIQNYTFDDRNFTVGFVNYYRLSQTDIDGTQTYVGSIIPINNLYSNKRVVARYNAMGQEVGPDAKGVVITLYEDGTTERIYVD